MKICENRQCCDSFNFDSFGDTEEAKVVIVKKRNRLTCFSGMMKLFISIGILVILCILVLESIYFRRAIFVLMIPALVIVSTVAAVVREDERLVWPIIGISFFHMFLAAYATLIFLFYFFFKPLYIIMVLNWAFDTLHTTKTTSFYLYCLCIFVSLNGFFFFNFWQLRVSLGFQRFLDTSKETRSSNSGAPSSTEDTLCERIPSTDKILNELPVVYLARSQTRIIPTNHDDVGLQNAFALSSGSPPRHAVNSLGGNGEAIRFGNGSRRSSFAEGRRFAI